MINNGVRHVLLVAGARDVTGALKRLHPELTITTMVAVQRLEKVRRPNDCARILALDDSRTTEEWITIAKCVNDIQQIQAVAAFGEFDQDRAAAIAATLSLPFHPEDVIARVYDKVLMRQRLSACGVEETPSAPVTTTQELKQFAGTHGLPLILKPQCGTGSLNVMKLSSEAELDEALFRVDAAADDPGLRLVVEPYLDGTEISVEAFSEDRVHRILGITHKLTDENFVELGHLVREPRADDALVGAHVTRVLDALGITTGPTHTELILTAAGPRVVETHTRAGGDQIPQLLHAATGIDMIELAVRQLLGERVLPIPHALPGRNSQTGAIRYLVPPKSGRLVAVQHIVDARALPLVTGCTVLKKPGDRLTAPVRSSLDRLAYCTAVAHDGMVAQEAAARAVDTIAVVVEEDGRGHVQATPSGKAEWDAP